MPALHDTQRWLASLILEPERVEVRAAELTERLDGTDLETAIARIGAYTGGYPARLREALAETFPAVEHVVGSSAFAELTLRYREAVPHGTYSLSEVGANLPAFLAGDMLGERLPFVADLARLEWAVQRAFHARLEPLLDPRTLADWTLADWERCLLTFQAGLAVVRSPWPVVDVWRARETPIDEIDIALESRPQNARVRRSGYKVACEAIDDGEATALELLDDGLTLGEAAAHMAGSATDAQAVSRWFAQWMQYGLILRCERDPRS